MLVDKHRGFFQPFDWIFRGRQTRGSAPVLCSCAGRLDLGIGILVSWIGLAWPPGGGGGGEKVREEKVQDGGEREEWYTGSYEQGQDFSILFLLSFLLPAISFRFGARVKKVSERLD